jgi:hypothetical protein
MIIVKQKEAGSLREAAVSPDEVIGLSGFKRVEIIGRFFQGAFDLPGGGLGTIVSGQRGSAKPDVISLSAGGRDIVSFSVKTVRAVHAGIRDVSFEFNELIIALRR